MFVIPLGLQAKTRDFPWMTTLIAVVTVVYAVFTFGVAEHLGEQMKSDPSVVARLQKQKQLALQACPVVGLEAKNCASLAKILEPEKTESTEEFVKRFLLAHQKGGALEKVPAKDLQRLAQMVVQSSEFRRAPAAIRELPAYAEFAEALTNEEGAIKEIAREDSILTKGTFTVKNLLRSLFLHAGWSHILGNMVFFLLFAIPLESRIGPLALFLVYFIGGSFGMTFELLMNADPSRPILGASAAVSAVGAAFMVSFWAASLRVWVSFLFLVQRVVLIRTGIFFALFVLMQDVSGALAPTSDGVAHFAHLGGFFLGVVLGAIAAQLRPVPAPFVFPFELKLFQQSRVAANLELRIAGLREVLFYNPFNSLARDEAWGLIEKWGPVSWESMPKVGRVFLHEQFVDLLISLQKAEKSSGDEMVRVLHHVEMAQWPPANLVNEKNVGSLMTGLLELQSAKNVAVALLLARFISLAVPQGPHATALRFITRQLENAPENGIGNIYDTAKSRSGS